MPSLSILLLFIFAVSLAVVAQLEYESRNKYYWTWISSKKNAKDIRTVDSGSPAVRKEFMWNVFHVI